ncbi:MAG TPA: CinA family protein [candidate division Zixibacteria bacterium]|nr:CinA family protein [candidate division Zixibacteria bacterium]
MSLQDELLELAAKVHDELLTRGLTIAIAESCTGGLASSLITDLDGSSEILPFSLVTYSADAKEEFLGIPPFIIRDFGTISLECVKLMAEGLLDYEVDFGLATTGVIGESIEGKLKGTAHVAVAVAGQKTFAKDLTLDPNKTRIELKQEIVKNLFEVLIFAIDSIF